MGQGTQLISRFALIAILAVTVGCQTDTYDTTSDSRPEIVALVKELNRKYGEHE